MNNSLVRRLEKYTLQHPQEVIIVNITIDNEEDKIAIFKGFSSSLMRSTAFDPDIPVLPDTATILNIDRLLAPYNPESPKYIQTGITWETMEVFLSAGN
jgi:hypothetical protein